MLQSAVDWTNMAPPLPRDGTGAEVGPPDFIGVGVQRCGTTRWFDLIGAHPEVLGAAGPKELHYFDRFFAGGCTREQLERYHGYFPKHRPGKTGEWTPVYATAPWIPPLLAAAAPEALLLVLLRDPVERYLSGLQHLAERARRQGTAPSRHAPLEQLERGCYHTHLLGLLRHFARERVLVLQYERCTREPLEQLRRTFEFLGLKDVEHAPDLGARPEHQPSKPTLDDATRRAYVEFYEPEVGRLLEAFPELDASLWPNFAHLATR
ncbi:MAG TPA: sulfotransferase [Solirubrobacteraceae bacterium]|jgi:hypothetical protein|nr:sulfotransferase [Solirubrobacteraceae bacterium]